MAGYTLVYKIGFTGTKKGTTLLQYSTLAKYFIIVKKEHEEVELAQGDCIGADDEATKLGFKYGYYIRCHPPENPSLRAFGDFDYIHEPKPYLVRNHDIVDACDELVATPREFTEQLRSGTWATIRYARKMRKPIRIIYPDGSTILQ